METVELRDKQLQAPVAALKTNRLIQFDGLRGIAIIIVVMSHCGILRQGGVANAIFFALAGFLLINPFKDAYEQRFLSIWNILKFYRSRALRILPAYYLVLGFLFIQTGFSVIQKETFISLLNFGDIYEHLWYVYSYFWLMFFIPYVFWILLLLAKKISFLRKDLVCAVIFIILSALIRLFYLFSDMFDIRLDQLMICIAAGYVFRYIRANVRVKEFFKKHSIIGQLLIVLLFLSIIFTSCYFLKLFDVRLADYYVGWELLFTVSVIMSVLVILVALYPDGFIGKKLQNKALTFVGKHAFVIYLLNNFVISQLNIGSKYFLFLCVFSVCLILAWMADTLIDKIIGIFKNIGSGKNLSEAGQKK